MILIIFCCILSLTLLCFKFGTAGNYTFFGVKTFFLNFGLYKKYEIWNLWQRYEFLKGVELAGGETIKIGLILLVSTEIFEKKLILFLFF